MYTPPLITIPDPKRIPAAITLLEESLRAEGFPRSRPVLRMPTYHEEPTTTSL